MNPKIRLICEGDIDCTVQVFMTKEELITLNKESKVLTCPNCRPKYENDIRADPLDLGESEN